MKIEVVENESLAAHTTWQIGGPAKYFVQAVDTDDLIAAVNRAAELGVPYYVIGNGSNLLVGDKGFPGMVIKLRGSFTGIGLKHNIIMAEAGVKLGTLVMTARKKSLEGIAFAAGIPGTVGGAMVMNAGGQMGTMSDIAETLTILNAEGEVETLTVADIKLGYRMSNIKEKGIILSATFRLEPGDPAKVTQEIVDALDQKRRTQPIEARTAGSVFKNPAFKHAAQLIEKADCKGMQVGGAVVSRMHANFILNVGGATAADVVNLMDQVADKVKESSGTVLEREVELVGEF
jgi:UDP-N-acetylmuramate dehydrogenase